MFSSAMLAAENPLRANDDLNKVSSSRSEPKTDAQLNISQVVCFRSEFVESPAVNLFIFLVDLL